MMLDRNPYRKFSRKLDSFLQLTMRALDTRRGSTLRAHVRSSAKR